MIENEPFESYFHENHLHVPPTLAFFQHPALHLTRVLFVSVHHWGKKEHSELYRGG